MSTDKGKQEIINKLYENLWVESEVERIKYGVVVFGPKGIIKDGGKYFHPPQVDSGN